VPVNLNCIPAPSEEPGIVVDVDGETKQGLGYTGPSDEYEFEEAIPLYGTIPSRVDLRDKYLDEYAKHQSNQGTCGWCVAHATTHHIEAVQARKKTTATSISEPHLWYLGGLNINDCDGGWNILPALSVVITNKLLKESDWKYIPPVTGNEMKVPSKSVLNHADITCTGVNSVNQSSESGITVTDKLKNVLASSSTVIVGVAVFGIKAKDSDDCFLPQWSFNSTSPVDLPIAQESICGGHAIMLVGYDDNDSGGSFIFRNSWGNSWQDNGYGRITYSYMNQYLMEAAYLSKCTVGCVPETEKCDNQDNDCDGQVDDNLSRTCGSNIGECSAGVQVCTKGTWSPCTDEIPAEIESCDGKDNDCDGDTDEDFSIGDPCGTGACAGGDFECAEDGKSSICNTMPGGSKDQSTTEICDLIDNDCDGLTDENLIPIEQPIENRCPTRGVCSDGAAVNTCVNGKWECSFPADYEDVECQVALVKCGTGLLSNPSCSDGLDNDCDGVTDENSAYYRCRDLPDFPKIAQGIECFHGPYGRCQTSGGTYECIQLAETCGVQIDCVGGIHPETERCDGQDWDCDGKTYDRGDIDLDGYGDCSEHLDCNESNPDINPGATEICDGKDNDCNGLTDEKVDCGINKSCVKGKCQCLKACGTSCCSSTAKCCGSYCMPNSATCAIEENGCYCPAGYEIANSSGGAPGWPKPSVPVSCYPGIYSSCGRGTDSDQLVCPLTHECCSFLANDYRRCCRNPAYSDNPFYQFYCQNCPDEEDKFLINTIPFTCAQTN